MKEKLLFFSVKHPLLLILLLAIVLRLLAVVFTGGYMEFDIYSSAYWGIPESWLANPWIVYSSRLVLGAFSLLIITLSYRITKIIADKTTALEIALLLACLWGVPYLSVHPVAAFISLPFLLYGTLLIVKQDNLLKKNETEKFHRTTYIIAGFVIGLGFAASFFSLIYYIGIILALLILKNWKGALMTLIGYIVAVGLTQTVIDIIIYRRPTLMVSKTLVYLGDYLEFFNKDALYANVMMTIGFLLLLMVFPLSLMLLFGFFSVCRKYVLLFLPAALLIVFSLFFVVFSHDFILLIIPTYLIAGYVGWKEYYKKSEFWTKKKWPIWTCYSIFALINTVLLVGSYIYF
jgi:hypothetical protein